MREETREERIAPQPVVSSARYSTLQIVIFRVNRVGWALPTEIYRIVVSGATLLLDMPTHAWGMAPNCFGYLLETWEAGVAATAAGSALPGSVGMLRSACLPVL
jgi:hypothetical protein